MLYDSLLNRSHQCRLAALTRNPVDHAILFSWVNGILWHTRCDGSVVSTLEIVYIPNGCTQRGSCSE